LSECKEETPGESLENPLFQSFQCLAKFWEYFDFLLFFMLFGNDDHLIHRSSQKRAKPSDKLEAIPQFYHVDVCWIS